MNNIFDSFKEANNFSKFNFTTERDLAKKYNKPLKDIILLVKKGLEIEHSINPEAKDIKRLTVVKNLNEKGLDYYSENYQFNTKNTTRFSDAIILDSSKRILLLLRRKDSDFSPNTWGLPGGHIDPGEKPEEAVVRELFEETGFKCQSPKLIFTYLEEGTEIYYYFCSPQNFNHNIILDSEEHNNYKWFSFFELPPNLVKENLRDNLQKIYKSLF